jgi:tRNA pseudouridine55 synthase
MDGLLIIDKPAGLTSHDVVARVRRVLGTKRVGHTGTLDPFATGVLILVVGGATRLAQFIDKDEKEYEALVRFGFETDTGDRTGSRTSHLGVGIAELQTKLGAIRWEKVLSKFRGEILQTPPMYSAKKVHGKKLYELARKGVEVERKPLPVIIHRLEITASKIRKSEASLLPEEGWPTLLEAGVVGAISIRVVCSAGTYIRTLAQDIGREAGVGAHLAELRRTRAGIFRLEDAIPLSEFENMADPAVCLWPLTEAVAHLPAVTLSADRAEKTRNGLSTRIDNDRLPDGSAIRMLDPASQLIAIGTYRADQKSVKPKIVLI